MKVKAVMMFATTGGSYDEGAEYDVPAEFAEALIASGHLVRVEAPKAPKKAAAKKAAAKKVAVETAATDL